MPEGAVYVGRGSRWGNAFVVGKDGTAEDCVRKFANDLLPYSHIPPFNTMAHFMLSEANLTDIQQNLRGKDLACWCALGEPCHANLLLELANLPGDR